MKLDYSFLNNSCHCYVNNECVILKFDRKSLCLYFHSLHICDLLLFVNLGYCGWWMGGNYAFERKLWIWCYLLESRIYYWNFLLDLRISYSKLNWILLLGIWIRNSNTNTWKNDVGMGILCSCFNYIHIYFRIWDSW